MDATSLLFGVIGLATGFASLAFAWWVWKYPRTDAEVVYGVRCSTVAPPEGWTDLDGDLAMTYRGRVVPSVGETIVSFRNFGPSRLDKDCEEEPVLVMLPVAAESLAIESPYATQVGERTIHVLLGPLLAGETRTVRILHTCAELEPKDVIVHGQLRGVARGLQRYEPGNRGWRRLGRRLSIGVDRVDEKFGRPIAVALLWALFFGLTYLPLSDQNQSQGDRAGSVPFWLRLAVPSGLVLGLMIFAALSVTVYPPVRTSALAAFQRWKNRDSPFPCDPEK